MRWAGQAGFRQRRYTPPSSRATSPSQAGHCEGGSTAAASAGRCCDVDLHNLRDDLARLLDEHPIAHVQIEPSDLVEVVQRGVLHRRAGELHRVHHGSRCNGAELADLKLHPPNRRPRLFRGEFVRDAPARVPARGTEFVALAEVVDLDHQAVSFVRQAVPAFIPRRQLPDDFLDRRTQRAIRAHRDAPLLQAVAEG